MKMVMPALLYQTAVMELSLTQSLQMRKETLFSSKVSFMKCLLTKGYVLEYMPLG